MTVPLVPSVDLSITYSISLKIDFQIPEKPERHQNIMTDNKSSLLNEFHVALHNTLVYKQ